MKPLSAWFGGLDPATLDPSFEQQLGRARSAHPALTLTDDTFVEHVARHLGRLPASEVGPALLALHGPDLFLALAGGLGEAAACAVLEREFLSRLPALLERGRFERALAEDACQSFRAKLLVAEERAEARILSYSGRGPLLAWLRVGATRVALNLRRATVRADLPLPADDVFVADGVMPDLAFIREMHREQFSQAFLMAFAELTDRQRTLLKLAYVDGLSMDKIGLIYGAHKSSVSRWLTEAREQLDQSTRSHLKSSLDISDSTCDDLVFLLRSHLEVSLRALFQSREQSGPVPGRG